MMKQWITSIAALAVMGAGALWGPSLAANQAADPDLASQNPVPLVAALNEQDQAFLMKAAQGNMFEVQLGTLATQRAMGDRVKQFGQRMVQDHGKAQQELMNLAKEQNWMLPAEVSDEQKKEQERLGQLSGEAFDKAYMETMVKDHAADATMYEAASTNSQDAALKGYAARTLQIIKEHLTQAREISGIKAEEAQPG
jgi:putative membrane protein